MEIQGCPYVEKGVKSGPPLVFMSGFPDNETSGWGTALPDELTKKYRCIFMCMPGSSQVPNPVQQNRPWGYEHEEVLTMMYATLVSVGLGSKKFTLIAHDWGAFYALLYSTRHPDALNKLILCDVGMVEPLRLPVTHIPFILFYQIYFAVSYIVSQTISFNLGMAIFLSFRRFFPFMNPSPADRMHVPDSEVTVKKCYPYYYIWKRLLTGTMLKTNFPTCPLLFMVNVASFYSFFFKYE